MNEAGEPELADDRQAEVAIQRVRKLSAKFPSTRIAVREAGRRGIAVIDEGGGR
ncbi:MAG: hypothetical protein ACRDPT_10680 [Streptomycetales bacterium]